MSQFGRERTVKETLDSGHSNRWWFRLFRGSYLDHQSLASHVASAKQYHYPQGPDMAAWIIAACVVAVLTANGVASAQSTGVISPSLRPVVLVDSTGKAAAKPLNESIMLVAISSSVTAPASIRPIYGPDRRTASGLATWQAGGSVLFTSPDCTAGANVYSSSYAGVRATTQVQTLAGIILYVGAIGPATTVSVQSVLYDTGCAPLVIQQNGLVPVLATINLTTVYPPPLSFQ